ncbi:MAG: copper chaperone PCu(A)C [Wenzhouxiangella sp.]
MKLFRPLIALVLMLPALTLADQHLEIIDPWSPEAPPGRMMAGFMELRNHADETIVLVDASSPQFGHVEIHTMVMEDGVMRMRRLEQLPIQAGDAVTLEPGGLHLMFIEPLEQMRLGDRIAVELIDEQGRRYPLQAEVRARHRPGMGH